MSDAVIQKVEQAIRDFVYDAVFTDTANAEMRKEGYGGRSLDGGRLNDLMNQLKAAARSTSPAKERKLAVMRHVRFGVGDRGVVWLQFDAYVSESVAALQVLSVEDAVKLIEELGVADVADLNGKTIWVDEYDGLLRYVGGCKL